MSWCIGACQWHRYQSDYLKILSWQGRNGSERNCFVFYIPQVCGYFTPRSMNCSLQKAPISASARGHHRLAPLPRVHWTLSAPIKAVSVNLKGASLLPQLPPLMGQGRWSCVRQFPSQKTVLVSLTITATPFCAPQAFQRWASPSRNFMSPLLSCCFK